MQTHYHEHRKHHEHNNNSNNFYDNSNIYVTFRAWESQPERAVVNEMRRDSNNIRQGDSVEFAFDTFRDRRNALEFIVNPAGVKRDGAFYNEGSEDMSWDGVWDVASRVTDDGWVAEIVVRTIERSLL